MLRSTIAFHAIRLGRVVPGGDRTAVRGDSRRYAQGGSIQTRVTRARQNTKVPVIVDDGGRVFASNAILLAEKPGQFFYLRSVKTRGELLLSLMSIASGTGP